LSLPFIILSAVILERRSSLVERNGDPAQHEDRTDTSVCRPMILPSLPGFAERLSQACWQGILFSAHGPRRLKAAAANFFHTSHDWVAGILWLCILYDK